MQLLLINVMVIELRCLCFFLFFWGGVLLEGCVCLIWSMKMFPEYKSD